MLCWDIDPRDLDLTWTRTLRTWLQVWNKFTASVITECLREFNLLSVVRVRYELKRSVPCGVCRRFLLWGSPCVVASSPIVIVIGRSDDPLWPPFLSHASAVPSSVRWVHWTACSSAPADIRSVTWYHGNTEYQRLVSWITYPNNARSRLLMLSFMFVRPVVSVAHVLLPFYSQQPTLAVHVKRLQPVSVVWLRTVWQSR